MPISEAKKRADRKWNKANYARIPLDVSLKEKDDIKTHAAEHGESMRGFAIRAIRETIERDNLKKRKPLPLRKRATEHQWKVGNAPPPHPDVLGYEPPGRSEKEPNEKDLKD